MSKKDPAKWGPGHRFTPEEFEAYEKCPRWMLDSPDFTDEDQYHAHWSSTIADWLQQSKRNQAKWKSTCQDAVRTVEEFDDGVTRAYSFERSLAYKSIAIAKAHIEELVALLCVNPPQGTLVSMQEQMGPYISASNQIVESEFKANNFDQTFNDTIYDIAFFRLGWWKMFVDYEQYGPYGQQGQIRIEKRDPEDIYVDPRARSLEWSKITWIIEESEHEIGEIRETYPVSGFYVNESDESGSFSNMNEERSQDAIASPIPKMDQGTMSKRNLIKVHEAWFKDTRLEFVPDREDREEEDEFGFMRTMTNALRIDEEGFVIGQWLPMYPKGRCIVICGDTILEDLPNRLPHGESPFIPVQRGPARNPFTPGVATTLITLGQKLNDVISRIHDFMQSETTRPMETEMGSLANAQYYKRLPNRSDKVIVLQQGKSGTLVRRAPTEVPQFVFALIQQYLQLMDLISGSSAIMRGNISDGAQLSAEAMQALQSFASSRVAVSAKYASNSVKKAYRQCFWLVRRIYDENIKVQCTLPDGSSATVDWKSDKQVFESGNENAIAQLVAKEDFLVELRTGTGTPNAAQAQKAEADHLYQGKAIDIPAYLDAYQYPNRQAITKRIEEREKLFVAFEALGRKLGMNIVKAEKAADKPASKSKVNGGS